MAGNERLLYPRNMTQIASLGAVNCHPEHIVCLGWGIGYETILVFVFNELRLFCGVCGMAGMAHAHITA